MRWIIAALLTFQSTNLFAQSSNSRGYVLGGLIVPWQEGITTGDARTYLGAPGGWSLGVFAGGGVHIGRTFSVEAEWHRTGIMEQVEPSRYSITYSARRRDTAIAVGGRVHVGLSNWIAFEPVGLFEFVREESWLAERQEQEGLPPTGNVTDYSSFVNSWGTGLAGGIDVRAGGRHLAVLPGIRFHRFWRDAEDGVSSTWPGGVVNWGVEITVGVRADF